LKRYTLYFLNIANTKEFTSNNGTKNQYFQLFLSEPVLGGVREKGLILFNR